MCSPNGPTPPGLVRSPAPDRLVSPAPFLSHTADVLKTGADINASIQLHSRGNIAC
jgi:hypothetical protein